MLHRGGDTEDLGSERKLWLRAGVLVRDAARLLPLITTSMGQDLIDGQWLVITRTVCWRLQTTESVLDSLQAKYL